MKKNINLDSSLSLKELTKEEITTIFGGDKFSEDLGYSLGYLARRGLYIFLKAQGIA